MLAKLSTLLIAEDGQAMTANAGFLGGCAVLAGLAYYYCGERAYNFINMIVSSPPPGTSATLFQ